jgi:glycosyltransferase involved in cell wall biosynthesis
MTVTPSIDQRVAICVCTHSRTDVLLRLLDSLRTIEFNGYDPATIELIVIDNDPNTNTRVICEQAAPEMPIAIYYTREPVSGVTYARNHAVNVALERGADLVAFIDDDDQPQPDWLIRLLERQRATGADLVFGSWVLDENMPAWAQKSGLFRSPTKSKEGKKGGGRYGLPTCASTCNLLAGREILQRVGEAGPVFSHAFCNSGGEDKDFFLRAQDMGASVTSAELSIVHRKHGPERYTAMGLLRRGFKNGCSGVSMARRHGDSKRLLKLLGINVTKLTISLILLPFTIFSRPLFMHSLYRMAKACGALYTTFTGRSFKYYSR